MKPGERTSFKMNTPPREVWRGGENFNILEHADTLNGFKREFISINTNGPHNSVAGSVYIHKDAILSVAMFLFEFAEREGLVENKEETS